MKLILNNSRLIFRTQALPVWKLDGDADYFANVTEKYNQHGIMFYTNKMTSDVTVNRVKLPLVSVPASAGAVQVTYKIYLTKNSYITKPSGQVVPEVYSLHSYLTQISTGTIQIEGAVDGLTIDFPSTVISEGKMLVVSFESAETNIYIKKANMQTVKTACIGYCVSTDFIADGSWIFSYGEYSTASPELYNI